VQGRVTGLQQGELSLTDGTANVLVSLKAFKEDAPVLSLGQYVVVVGSIKGSNLSQASVLSPLGNSSIFIYAHKVAPLIGDPEERMQLWQEELALLHRSVYPDRISASNMSQ